eukprot:m51a1_g5731 hypothetical protein (545) ;mRNA; r:1133463-1136870
MSPCTEGKITHYDYNYKKTTGTAPNDMIYFDAAHKFGENALACGVCYELVGPRGATRLMVTDHCPDCANIIPHFDLSVQASDKLLDPLTKAGTTNVTFRMVSCDVTGPIRIKLKSTTSEWYTSFTVVNHRVMVTKLEMSLNNGTSPWSEITREDVGMCCAHGAHSHSHSHSHSEQPFQPPELSDEQHFDAVILAFQSYPELMTSWIQVAEAAYMDAPARHRAAAPTFLYKLAQIRSAVSANAAFLSSVIADHSSIFLGSAHKEPRSEAPREVVALGTSPFYADKVRTTLCQFARDWAAEGAAERAACYSPLLDELDRRFPDRSRREEVRVLTPGAGLGRLTFEVAARGFYSQGNEFSYFMLIGSHYALNKATRANERTIFPYVRQSSNVVRTEDQLRSVTVPDVVPSEVFMDTSAPRGQMSMVAGDFVEVYGASSQESTWDAVVTCFFIDTAHNVLEYLEIISKLLKPGGVWINLGPLLYHYADMPGEISIELTWEEIKEALPSFGFTLEKEERASCSYTSNKRSMLCVTYNCMFTVCTRAQTH